MMSSEVARVASAEEMQIALGIRHTVFVLEQHVPESEEQDADDARATHLLARVDGRPLGTARIVDKGDGRGKVGRVAVLSEGRGTGLGRLLMEAAHREPFRELILDAQVQVIPFYESLGYVAEGPTFEECGILHRRMVRCRP